MHRKRGILIYVYSLIDKLIERGIRAGAVNKYMDVAGDHFEYLFVLFLSGYSGICAWCV